MTYYRKMNAFTFVSLLSAFFASFSAWVRSATLFSRLSYWTCRVSSSWLKAPAILSNSSSRCAGKRVLSGEVAVLLMTSTKRHNGLASERCSNQQKPTSSTPMLLM